MIKSLSIHEPYASLIRTGAKTYETRSWPTKYRGLLLICAAKGGMSKKVLMKMLGQCHVKQGLFPLANYKISPSAAYNRLNFGRAVALVEIVDCFQVPSPEFDPVVEAKQTWYGDFNPGMYAWKLKMINNTFKPFPVKGQQGLFSVNVEGKV